MRFAEIIYVLHCFQKKANKGIATKLRDIDLIRRRLQMAEIDYETRMNKRG